jgi:hypothetical protein
MWNEYLPMSMPIMAISTAGTLALAILGIGRAPSDGAPSSEHDRPLLGQEHGRTIPLADVPLVARLH